MARRPATNPSPTRPWPETDTDSTWPDNCFDYCDSYKKDMTAGSDPLERYWNYLSNKYLYSKNWLHMREIWPIYFGLVKLWRGNPNWVQIFPSWNSLLDSNQSLTILEKQILFHYIFAQISPKNYGLSWIIGNIINNPIVHITLPLTKRTDELLVIS